jgi:hypothetical protein
MDVVCIFITSYHPASLTSISSFQGMAFQMKATQLCDKIYSRYEAYQIGAKE